MLDGSEWQALRPLRDVQLARILIGTQASCVRDSGIPAGKAGKMLATRSPDDSGLRSKLTSPRNHQVKQIEQSDSRKHCD